MAKDKTKEIRGTEPKKGKSSKVRKKKIAVTINTILRLIGLPVRYYPSPKDKECQEIISKLGAKYLSAKVTDVESEEVVNLTVHNPLGLNIGKTAVPKAGDDHRWESL